jgi:nucleoside-diphosphate-sugar epimerase
MKLYNKEELIAFEDDIANEFNAGKIKAPIHLYYGNEFKKDFDQRNYRVSNAKLESLGWSPLFSLDRGIKELILGYKLINKFKNKDFTNL